MFKFWRFIVLALLLIAGTWYFFVRTKTSSREYASSRSGQPWAHSVRGKFMRPLEVNLSTDPEVSASTDPEVSASEETTIFAEVKVIGEFGSQLSYAWGLPDGVAVVDGSLNGEFLDPLPGKIFTTQLVVKNFMGQESLRSISLQVFEDRNGTKFGAAGAISNAARAAAENDNLKSIRTKSEDLEGLQKKSKPAKLHE